MKYFFVCFFLLSCTGPMGPPGESEVVIFPEMKISDQIRPDIGPKLPDLSLSDQIQSDSDHCIPDQLFCDGLKHRKCNQSGADSFLLYECSSIGSVITFCELCSNKYACKPTNPILSGTMMLPDGPLQAINWYGTEACGSENMEEARVTISATSGLFQYKKVGSVTPTFTLYFPLTNGTTSWGKDTTASMSGWWTNPSLTSKITVLYGKIPPEEGTSISLSIDGWMTNGTIQKSLIIKLIGWIH